MRGRCAGSDPRFDAAPGGAARPLGWRHRFVLGLSARRRLLDVFQAEQHLIFRQRLGAAAEAMALQLLDDLAQPLGAARSASSIAFSVPGSSGACPSAAVMKRDYIIAATTCEPLRLGLIHSVADQPGCTGAGVSRAA